MVSIKMGVVIILVSVFGMFAQKLYSPDFMPLTTLLIGIGLLIIDVLEDILYELRKKQSGSLGFSSLTKKETKLLAILNKYPQGIQMKELIAETGDNINTLRTHLLNMKVKGVVESFSSGGKKVRYRVKK